MPSWRILQSNHRRLEKLDSHRKTCPVSQENKHRVEYHKQHQCIPWQSLASETRKKQGCSPFACSWRRAELEQAIEVQILNMDISRKIQEPELRHKQSLPWWNNKEVSTCGGNMHRHACIFAVAMQAGCDAKDALITAEAPSDTTRSTRFCA